MLALLSGTKGGFCVLTFKPQEACKREFVICRRSLKREGSGPVAAAGDGLELQSRVRLLDGPFFEGQYMIGSVNFVKAAASESSETEEGRSQHSPN